MEREINLRNDDYDYVETEAIIYYVGRNYHKGVPISDLSLISEHGYVVAAVPKLQLASKFVTSQFVPDIFHTSLVSEHLTERVYDKNSNEADSVKRYKNIPKPYYYGFGRACSNEPGKYEWGSVWDNVNDAHPNGRRGRTACLIAMLKTLEDYMLDGWISQEGLSAQIEAIGKALGTKSVTL